MKWMIGKQEVRITVVFVRNRVMIVAAVLGYFNTLQLQAVEEIKDFEDVFSILFYVFMWDVLCIYVGLKF